MSGTDVATSLYVLAVLGALALVVAWVLLPIALIGTKPLLRKLIEEQRKTNNHLEALRKASDEMRRNQQPPQA